MVQCTKLLPQSCLLDWSATNGRAQMFKSVSKQSSPNSSLINNTNQQSHYESTVLIELTLSLSGFFIFSPTLKPLSLDHLDLTSAQIKSCFKQAFHLGLRLRLLKFRIYNQLKTDPTSTNTQWSLNSHYCVCGKCGWIALFNAIY